MASVTKCRGHWVSRVTTSNSQIDFFGSSFAQIMQNYLLMFEFITCFCSVNWRLN